MFRLTLQTDLEIVMLLRKNNYAAAAAAETKNIETISETFLNQSQSNKWPFVACFPIILAYG